MHIGLVAHGTECALPHLLVYKMERLGLVPADVAVDEENGRVFGVGTTYDAAIDSRVLNARAFSEAGDTLWNFKEYGRNPLLVRLV